MSRHRRYQITITLCVLCTAVVSVVAPHLEHWTMAGTVATNLLWLWE